MSATHPARASARPLARARLRRLLPGFLLGLLIFAVHTVSPSPQSADSRLSVVVGWQVLTHGNLHLENVPAVRALLARGDLLEYHGHLVPFFPWPPMLLAIPGTIVARLFGIDPTTLSISDPNLTWLIEVPTASLIVAITAVLIRRIVLGVEAEWSSPRLAVAAALIFAFTTTAWSIGSRALWQQTASMLTIALVVLATQRLGRGTGWWLLLGVAAAAALVVRPTNAVLVLLVLGWAIWRRRSILPLALLGSAIILIPFAAFSLSQYGAILPPYYLPSRINDTPVYPFWESAAVNLVSPSRGLLVFVPVTLLAVAGIAIRIRRRRFGTLELVWVLAIVGQFLVISKFGSTGGFTYGPRLLLDLVPLLVLLAVPAFAGFRLPTRGTAGRAIAASAVVAVILAWGLFVNASGAIFRDSVCWNVTPATIDAAPERVWDTSDPQFLRAWKDLAAGRPVVGVSCTL